MASEPENPQLSRGASHGDGRVDIYTKKMHRSEWSSMLLNLLTNSIKAVKRAQRPRPVSDTRWCRWTGIRVPGVHG